MEGPMASRARRLWEGWKRFAERIAEVQAQVLLTAFYFLVVLPTAFLLRALADPLALERQRGSASRWVPREARATGLDEGRYQS